MGGTHPPQDGGSVAKVCEISQPKGAFLVVPERHVGPRGRSDKTSLRLRIGCFFAMGISHAGTVLDTEWLLLAGLSGFTLHDSGTAWVIQAVAGEGGVTHFSLDANTGALALLDQTVLSRAGQHALVDLGGGEALLLDRYADQLLLAEADTQSVTTAALPLSTRIETLANLTLASGNRIITWAEPGRGGIGVAEISAGGALISTRWINDTASRPMGDVRALDIALIDGNVQIIAGSGRDSGLTVLTGPSVAKLAEAQVLTASGDFAHYQVSTLARVETAGETFVIAGASASGSLSVFRVAPDGTLAQTDHLFDSRDTRFAGVDHIAAEVIDGRTLIAAGGADRGVTLFELGTDGTLHHLETIVDDATLAMDDIEGLALIPATTSGQALLVTGAAREGGISVLTLDLAALQPAAPVMPDQMPEFELTPELPMVEARMPRSSGEEATLAQFFGELTQAAAPEIAPPIDPDMPRTSNALFNADSFDFVASAAPDPIMSLTPLNPMPATASITGEVTDQHAQCAEIFTDHFDMLDFA